MTTLMRESAIPVMGEAAPATPLSFIAQESGSGEPPQNPDTLIFSDSHIFHPLNGAFYWQAQALYETRAKNIYANGDILDLEKFMAMLEASGTSALDLPADFSRAVDAVAFPELEKQLRLIDAMMYQADRGASVVYLTGNHDIGMVDLHGQEIEGIQIKKEDVVEHANGQRFLIEHGHMFDPGFVNGNYSGCISKICDTLLYGSLEADYRAHDHSDPYGIKDFPRTNALKAFAKSTINPKFKSKVSDKVAEMGLDGGICGHTHIGAITTKKGVRYMNPGDGFTHGTFLQSTPEDWELVTPLTSGFNEMSLMAERNPLAEYRPRTMNFLQRVWEAQGAAHIREYLQGPCLPLIEQVSDKDIHGGASAPVQEECTPLAA